MKKKRQQPAMNKLDHSTIYETRLLIFMETDSQSGKFNQIIFNKEQFGKVSEAIGKAFNEKKINDERYEVELPTSEEEYELPDLQSFVDNV